MDLDKRCTKPHEDDGLGADGHPGFLGFFGGWCEQG